MNVSMSAVTGTLDDAMAGLDVDDCQLHAAGSRVADPEMSRGTCTAEGYGTQDTALLDTVRRTGTSRLDEALQPGGGTQLRTRVDPVEPDNKEQHGEMTPPLLDSLCW